MLHQIAVAKKILDAGGSLYVHAKTEGSVVPEHLRERPYIVTQWGYDMPTPIYNLKLDSEGISGDLCFRGAITHCSFPWCNVFALVGEDKRGWAAPWMESFLKEVDTPATTPERTGNVIDFQSYRQRKGR